MFKKIFNNIVMNKPLVHCITNYVTVNDCANIILACGGSPIMADEIEEVKEITSICSSNLINIGTLNKRTIESMFIASKRANELKHPIVLDPVGCGASILRNNITFKLLEDIKFSVIKGNISEIKMINSRVGSTSGVDANEDDLSNSIEDRICIAKDLAKKTGSIVVISGSSDIIANDSNAYIVKNGSSKMSDVSGTGCMLGSIIAVYLGANKEEDYLEAVAAAVAMYGYCGELASLNAKGNASFKINLIDEVSKMNNDKLKGGIKIEYK